METPHVVDWRLLAKTTPAVTGKGAPERGRDTWTLDPPYTRCYSSVSWQLHPTQRFHISKDGPLTQQSTKRILTVIPYLHWLYRVFNWKLHTSIARAFIKFQNVSGTTHWRNLRTIIIKVDGLVLISPLTSTKMLLRHPIPCDNFNDSP